MTSPKPLLSILLLTLNLFAAQSWAASRDPYDVLGLPKNASFKEVKKAYWQLSQKYHPDRSHPDQVAEDEARFKEIKEAYEAIENTGQGLEVTPMARNAREAIDLLVSASSPRERAQAFEAMRRYAEDIAVNPSLRELANQAVGLWLGDGRHIDLTELTHYYGFLGAVEMMIGTFVNPDLYFERPFQYNRLILDGLAQKKDFTLENLIQLIQESGGFSRDKLGLLFGSSYKFSASSAEALFRFAVQKNNLKTPGDLEKFAQKIRPIFDNGYGTIELDFPYFLSKYMSLALSWVPDLKAASFERLGYYLPYHQNLILLEEALRQNRFTEPRQILEAVSQVQQAQDSRMGDEGFRGEENFRPLKVKSQAPQILKKNQERRALIYQAASARLKEMGASGADLQKLSSSLRLGVLSRSLMKFSNPWGGFQWPERDYASIEVWPQAQFPTETQHLLGRTSGHGFCSKMHRN
jgi:hypothetical protein